jgi:GH24 family phage-related lysozyme (muramidase)
LRDRIKLHEGLSSSHTSAGGAWTIATGTRYVNTKNSRIDIDQAERLLDRDIETAEAEARSMFPDSKYKNFTKNRWDVLTELVFNLGLTRFRGFKRMISSIDGGDWQQAAAELED